MIATKLPYVINKTIRAKINELIFSLRVIEDSHSIGEYRLGFDFRVGSNDKEARRIYNSSREDYGDSPESDSPAGSLVDDSSIPSTEELNGWELAIIPPVSDAINDHIISADEQFQRGLENCTKELQPHPPTPSYLSRLPPLSDALNPNSHKTSPKPKTIISTHPQTLP